MYSEDYEGAYSHERSDEDVYSKPVKAGKRTYFFDVKATKGNKDYFMTITERKRNIEKDGRITYNKHKIFLYKEDYDKFADGLQEVIDYIRTNCIGKETVLEEENAETSTENNEEHQFSDVKFDEF